jgi:putative transposase
MAFAQKWDKTYVPISKSWLTHWQHVVPFFQFSPEIRRIIYTTNAIESIDFLQIRLCNPDAASNEL